MKRLFTLLFLSATFAASAQIINGGFETWVPNGQNCSGPESWGTINGSTGIVGVCTVEQETSDVHSGNSALKLSTQQVVIPPVINETAPGICTNGTVNTQSEMVEGGDSFTSQPAAISFWYKASPVNQDEYSFSALLIDEVSGDTVGYAEASDTAIVSSYTEVVAPITYMSATPPTLLQIIFLPSNSNNPQIGSVLWVDDVTAVGDVSSVSESELSDIFLYPNPSTGEVFFGLGNQSKAVVSVCNILGVKVFETRVSTMNNRADLSKLAKGTYVWQLSSIEGEPIKTGKLILTQ